MTISEEYRTTCEREETCTLDCMFCERIGSTTDRSLLEDELTRITNARMHVVATPPGSEYPEAWARHEANLAELELKTRIISERIKQLQASEQGGKL